MFDNEILQQLMEISIILDSLKESIHFISVAAGIYVSIQVIKLCTLFA